MNSQIVAIPAAIPVPSAATIIFAFLSITFYISNYTFYLLDFLPKIFRIQTLIVSLITTIVGFGDCGVKLIVKKYLG